MEIGRAVVYYAGADQAFSAGIKCWHCMMEPPLCREHLRTPSTFSFPSSCLYLEMNFRLLPSLFHIRADEKPVVNCDENKYSPGKRLSGQPLTN